MIKWDEDNILDIIEKPSQYISNDAVIGVYIFDSNFKNHFQKLKNQQEMNSKLLILLKDYQLENIDSHYVGRGTAWFDMGSNDDFLIVLNLLRQYKTDKDYSYAHLTRLLTKGLDRI